MPRLVANFEQVYAALHCGRDEPAPQAMGADDADRCPLSPHKRRKSGHFLTAASVESRMGAVAWAIRQRPVSHPRSSNRACRFPASGFPTSFIEGHTGSDPTARGICPANDSASPFDTSTSDGSGLQRCCQAYRQSPRPRPSSEAHRKSGPFAPPSLLPLPPGGYAAPAGAPSRLPPSD
jgi:hypothetical protein